MVVLDFICLSTERGKATGSREQGAGKTGRRGESRKKKKEEKKTQLINCWEGRREEYVREGKRARGKKRGEGIGKHRHPMRDDAVLFLCYCCCLFGGASMCVCCVCVWESILMNSNDFWREKKICKGAWCCYYCLCCCFFLLLLFVMRGYGWGEWIDGSMGRMMIIIMILILCADVVIQ